MPVCLRADLLQSDLLECTNLVLVMKVSFFVDVACPKCGSHGSY